MTEVLAARTDLSAAGNRLPTSVRALASCLILASLACNIAALALPFVSLRKGVGSDPYTLTASVEMLWEKGLYALAVLVVGFSVLFPFAKLSVLAGAVFPRTVRPVSLVWLRRVERVGKWSMLDPFLVAILISLASKQLFVGAKPQAGLAFFTLAILLSLLCGELLSRRLHKHGTTPSGRQSPSRAALFLLSGVTLGAALALPFLRIEDWLLSNRSYSILALVPALWRQEGWAPGALCGAFLVTLPVFAWTASLACLLGQRFAKPLPRLQSWADAARRWSMLDVFGLALTIFALESDHIMSTEISWGALFLAATLALQAALGRSGPKP